MASLVPQPLFFPVSVFALACATRGFRCRRVDSEKNAGGKQVSCLFRKVYELVERTTRDDSMAPIRGLI